MKAKWIDEVAEIASSEDFADWLEGLHRTRKEMKAKAERYDEILTQVNLVEFRAELAHRNAIETLEESTRLEDAAAELENESAVLENNSFEVVSQFEMQRDRTTKLWEQLGGLDVNIEQASGGKKKSYQKQRDRMNEDYEREDVRKQRLWVEVEKLWIRNIDCNLALRERRHKSKVVRRKADGLFEAYEAESKQAKELADAAEAVQAEKVRAEQDFEKDLQAAKDKYACLLNEDFLYWVAREDNKVVYTVPLFDDAENYQPAVVAGQVYRTTPQLGIDGLVLVDPSEVTDAASRDEDKD